MYDLKSNTEFIYKGVYTMKKIVTLVLIMVTALALTTIAFADTSIAEVNVTESELLQDSVAQIQSDSSLSDYEKISLLTNAFFKAKEENYKSDNEVLNLSAFMYDSKSSQLSATSNDEVNEVQKILNHFIIEKYLRIASGFEILYDNLEIEIDNIEINDDTASVTLYEGYTYQTSISDIESFRGIVYTLHFEKISGEWLITKVDSNDETYDDELGYSTYDIQGKIDEILHPVYEYETVAEDDNILAQPASVDSGLLTVAYDRDRAAEYALNHSTKATRNTNFINYYSSGTDCQNFASQCVWYGFGGTDTAEYIGVKGLPMTPEWYATKSSASSAWISCTSFREYVVNCEPDEVGIIGNFTSSLTTIQVGDTIQYQKSNGEWHTYIVNAVTGKSGSRTTSNIWVCAHTTDRTNEQLSSIGLNESNLYAVRILHYNSDEEF